MEFDRRTQTPLPPSIHYTEEHAFKSCRLRGALLNKDGDSQDVKGIVQADIRSVGAWCTEKWRKWVERGGRKWSSDI